jgi:ankyrin repeat protein
MVNTTITSWPPLHTAAKNNDDKKITLLINSDANVNEKNKKDNTPLHIAAYYNSQKAVTTLIQNNADLNSIGQKGSTPLCMAACRGNLEIMKILLDAGADINKSKNTILNPLTEMFFTAPFHLECINLLIARGSRIKTALAVINSTKCVLSWSTRRLLLLAGNIPPSCVVDVKGNQQDTALKATALMYYAAQKNIERVKAELQRSDTLLEDIYGRNIFRILEIILTNKDDLELTLEPQEIYQKIMRLCYHHFTKHLWFMYHTHTAGFIQRNMNCSLSKLPLDILKVIMVFVTGVTYQPKNP